MESYKLTNLGRLDNIRRTSDFCGSRTTGNLVDGESVEVGGTVTIKGKAGAFIKTDEVTEILGRTKGTIMFNTDKYTYLLATNDLYKGLYL